MSTASKTAPISSQIDTLEVSDLLRILEQKDQLIAQHEQAIVDREQAIVDREHVIEDHKHIIEEQRKLLKLMEEKLRLARQKRFGASSEKLPYQGDFFDEAELEVALGDIEQQIQEQEKTPQKRRKPREGFSDKLPRIRVDLPLSKEEKAGASHSFFSKVKEELDIIPAKARVIEYWQEKAVFDQPDGSQRIEAGSRPAHPLGKCMASIQLLAYLLVAKYGDALPLYRLEKIFKRYAIEKRIESLNVEQKRQQRQALSVPVLDEFKAWLEKNSRRVVKDSLTWKAINYTLNQWGTLLGYCDDGQLHISNALAENAIRPFAVGRRNWLFSDTPRGARASATVFSLIETAKANDIEPYDYLLHVLKHIASVDTAEQLEACCPGT